MLHNNFYASFEDKHRGSRELIKSRLEVYIPFIDTLKRESLSSKAIDLGCGRGEWLELLTQKGFQAIGVDLNDAMLDRCRSLRLSVQKADALTALQECPDDTFAIVSGFHIAEHLEVETLQELISQALRSLCPGGLLILETPNVENLKVASENFYLDPTHTKPIPSQLLLFLAQHTGFERAKILRLQESKKSREQEFATLHSVLFDVSPDYAIIAQKKSPKEVMAQFDELFEKDYGLPLEVLTAKFENRIQKIEHGASYAQEEIFKLHQELSKYHEKYAKVEDEIRDLKEETLRVHQKYLEIINSNSWKLTKPLRVLAKVLRWFVHGIYHWATFSPSSRPRRVAAALLVKMRSYVSTKPFLRHGLLKVLNKFPKLKAKLKSVGTRAAQNAEQNTQLSPYAYEIYTQIKQHKKSTR